MVAERVIMWQRLDSVVPLNNTTKNTVGGGLVSRGTRVDVNGHSRNSVSAITTPNDVIMIGIMTVAMTCCSCHHDVGALVVVNSASVSESFQLCFMSVLLATVSC